MRNSSNAHFTGKLDSVAVLLSGLCLVHCLALPLVLAVFPLLGDFFIPHETFHQLILVVVLPTTALALGSGYRCHRRAGVLALGALGVACLVIAAFTVHRLGGDELERVTTILGGIVLACAHGWNFRLTRAQHAPNHPHAHADDALETRHEQRIARQ